MTKPQSCAYSKNASLNRGARFSASMTIERMLPGIATGNAPPKNPHAASKPRITSSVVWVNVGHTNWWRLKHAVKINPWHALLVPVGDQPEAAEVDLQLDARRRVVDAHGRGVPPGPTAFHRETRQRPVRDGDAFALEEDPDLDDGQLVAFHPLLDLLLLGEQRAPGPTVAVGADRADHLDQSADQLISELPLSA